MIPLSRPPPCKECGHTLPPRTIVAAGNHNDPGKYCSPDCAITAHVRGWAKFQKITKGFP